MKSIVRMNVCILSVFIAAGCQNSTEKANSLPKESPKTVFTSCNGPRIQAECVLTQYQTDGSRYITQQKQWICPSSRSITIEASEPGGRYVWQLKQGAFQVVQKPVSVRENSPLCSSAIAQAVLSLFLAGGGYLEMPSSDLESVKVEGVVYQPYDWGSLPQLPKIQGVTTLILQDESTGLIDRVEIKPGSGGKVIHGHAFNFRRNIDTDKILPTRIEIFEGGIRILDMTYFHITSVK
ncbi:MAG: hypothetical protein JXA82_13350 [Sedimentisphaerales bacterium]|nr:hypothetical protein [Sedimentisphaerales bacterium]